MKGNKRKNNNEEYQIQVAICQTLDMMYPDVLYTSDLGGFRLPIGLAVKAKKIRLRPGHPDMFIYEPRNGWHGLAIEIKTLNGKVKTEQLNWCAELKKRNYLSAITYGYRDTWRVISSYLR